MGPNRVKMSWTVYRSSARVPHLQAGVKCRDHVSSVEQYIGVALQEEPQPL